MSGRRQQRVGEAGFTLIETLIAMTLTVFILATLATLTAQWMPNWNRGFTRVQRMEVLNRGLERIVADLAAAEFVTANAKAKHVLFDGSELSVALLRPAIGPNTQPGLEFVRIGMTFVGVNIFLENMVFGAVLIAAVAITIDRSKIAVIK